MRNRVKAMENSMFVPSRSISLPSSIFTLVITWSSFLCLLYLAQGSSATSLAEKLHHSSGSRWEIESPYGSDRYERERDDLEPDDDEIPPPRNLDSRRGGGTHFKRYPSLSRRMLYSQRRERRQPHKYSVSDFDEEYIPKRSKYMRREDEEGEDSSRHQFSRHRHQDDDEYHEPETLPRTFRRSPVHSEFEDHDMDAPSYKSTRSVRPQRMRPSYNTADDGFPTNEMDDYHHRSATNYRRQNDHEIPQEPKEGFGYTRSYYKKYTPQDDFESNVRMPDRVPDFSMNKRQPAMYEEPHESYASYLQGMYGSTNIPQMRPAPSFKPLKLMSTPSWPGLTMDNIPILDPKPIFDKTFMENFLASNNKHFNSDSDSSSTSESSNDSNEAYNDNDSENEESQHHSQRLSKPQSANNQGRSRSLKSFMPFGFGNFFGGSPVSKTSGKTDASRVSNMDDGFDEEEDSTSQHDSCDSHDSSDSKRHVKFASPEIVPSTVKSTSIPISTPSSPSLSPPSLADGSTTKAPILLSNYNYRNKNISEVTNAM